MKKSLLMCVAALAAAPCFAQQDAAPVRVLEEKHQGGVSWLCGGVGSDESSYLKQEAKAHDLMLVFATRSGEYLADVAVSIDDAKGNALLRTNCDGPIMLVDLPKSGSYRIRSEANGVVREQRATVDTARRAKAAARQLVMTLPAPSEEAPVSTGSSGAASQPRR